MVYNTIREIDPRRGHPCIADETVGMDKGKLKPLGGAKRASGNKQQGGGAELDDEWQVVQEEELQVITTCKCRK